VIIFDLVRFLPIKTIKLKFSKLKKNRNRFKPTGFGSVRLFYIKNQNPTDQFWFCLVRFWCGLVSVRFDYFILKTKNYIVFWDFFWTFLMDLVSVWFGFFRFGFFIFRFGFSVSGLWNWNRTKSNIFLNILIGFFYSLVFSIIFFQFNRFFSFFAHPYLEEINLVSLVWLHSLPWKRLTWSF